jgi:hypothetical protein
MEYGEEVGLQKMKQGTYWSVHYFVNKTCYCVGEKIRKTESQNVRYVSS